MKFCLILSFILLPLMSASKLLAKEIPRADLDFLNQCVKSPDCELNFILEIAKTYRPPKEEDELRDYILAVKDMAEKHYWKKKLETHQDKIGNLMIRLPATGKFTKKKYKHFALQSHMDMVLAHVDAKPGKDLRPLFKNGIQLEIKDGWLQSVGNKSSIGTDNSSGVAYSLRYLIDPSIEHPPLELIFTVQEEIGLIGAMKSELPILSRKMICLDGMTPEPGYIIAGSQGASANHVHLHARGNEKVKAQDTKLISVSVTQLAGGHSGGDIHRDRANSLKLLAQLIKFISHETGHVSLKSLVAGDVGILNKIPNLFQAELAVPAHVYKADLKDKIEAHLKSMVQRNSDDAASAEIEVKLGEGAEGEYLTTGKDFATFLSEALLAAPNGVLDTDPMFANSVKLSNNLSFLMLRPEGDQFRGNFGFMIRSFDDAKMVKIKKELTGLIHQKKHFKEYKVVDSMNFAPWMEPDSSELLQTVLSIPEFSKKFYLAGGLEPSAFKLKLKGLEVVALSPFQQFAHSVKEKLKVDTIHPTGQNILKIIQAQKE